MKIGKMRMVIISDDTVINPKISIIFSSVTILLLSLILIPSAKTQPEASGNWLDNNLNWNEAGASLPQAPKQEENEISNCQHTVRAAVLPEDNLVETAGWTLTDAAQIYGATTIVTGMADADGMCRPLDYQVFVFTNGKFSGTLSPIPMDSRTDGSLIDFDLYRDGYIDASFNRYTPKDAQCCASKKSRVFYEVKMENDQPVLIPRLPADTSAK